MKQFLKKFFGFVIMAVAGYLLLVALWAHFVPFGFLKKNVIYPVAGKGFTHSRLAEANTVKDIDVLFLGSSHTFRGFDPRIFAKEGISSFNLGTPSQTPFQTRLLLEQYLDQFNPKLIVYEVYPATFQNDGVESSLDLIANQECVSCGFTMAKKVNEVKTYNSLIYDVFREGLGLNNGVKEPQTKGTDRYVKGGFVESEVQINESPITEKTRQNWKSDAWEIQDWQLEEFKKSLKMFRERGIRVVLLQVPVSKAAFDLYHNNEAIDELFTGLGSYYNLNHVLGMDDDRDFIDYHHLSQAGVEKTNEALINILQSEGYLSNE